MKKQNHLEFLRENLILNIDFNFLQVIKEKLPYHNAYYLICLVEVVNNFIDEEKYFHTYDETFQSVINKATKLYLSTDISSVFLYKGSVTH